ncbi:MAG: TerC family protein [Paenalcaligenes sp.]
MIEFFETLHWGALFQIVLIDILLGGDNAVVIALACRNLDHTQRIKGILWGTVGAIILRVLLIFFALTLLDIPFLKLVGAAMLFWIGLRLLIPDEGGHGDVKAGSSVWSAVKTILIADFVMSLDNVIAIAGAAQNTQADHQMVYVMFGLLLSVPIIIWGSTLVLKLIDRFPVLITLGAALLGWIAGGMLVTDIAITRYVGDISSTTKLIVEASVAVILVILGKWMARRQPTTR